MLMQALKGAKTLHYLRLSLDGSSRSRHAISAIARHIDSFPILRELSLAHVITTDDVLISFVSNCTNMLMNLSLYDIILQSGSWRNVFTYLSNRPRLAKLYLSDLHEDTRGVSFRPFHRERPIIDDYWNLRIDLFPDTEERDFLESYNYVTRQNVDTYVTLTDGDGEDICQWVFTVSNHYELMDIEPTVVY